MGFGQNLMKMILVFLKIYLKKQNYQIVKLQKILMKQMYYLNQFFLNH